MSKRTRVALVLRELTLSIGTTIVPTQVDDGAA